VKFNLYRIEVFTVQDVLATTLITAGMIASIGDLPLFVDLLKTLFQSRPDVIARGFFWDDAKGIPQKRYEPLCLNYWKNGVCPRRTTKGYKCRDCANRVLTGLTDALLSTHLLGKLVLGFYPLLKDATTWRICIDVDNHDGKTDAYSSLIKITAALCMYGVPFSVFRSRSGTGFHVYVFFETAVPAWKPRAVLSAIITETGITKGDGSGFDAITPKQDRLDGSAEFGNLVAMEYQGEAMKHGHTLMLDPATEYKEPYANQLTALQGVLRVAELALAALLTILNIKPFSPPMKIVNPPAASSVPAVIPQGQRNSTLLSLAGTMHKRGMDIDAIRAALHTQNQRSCSPPLPDSEVDSIAKSIARYQQGQLINGTHGNGQRLGTIFQAPGIDPRLVIPEPYSLTAVGHITKLAKDGRGNYSTKTISYAPIVVVAKLEDIENGSSTVELAWLSDGKIKRRVVDRVVIAEARAIVSLARFDFPVTSTTAKDLVEFLAAFIEANKDAILTKMCSSSLGWQGTHDVFLWGTTPITPTNGQAPQIVFRGHDSGDDQIAAGFYQEGSDEEWYAAVNSIYKFPLAIFYLLAILITPFLRVLKVPNMFIDLANDNSFGKTILMMLAMAGFGNPEKSAPKHVVHSFKNTEVWLERALAMHNGIPFCADDTKEVLDPEMLSKIVYMHASGEGKGRGSLGGTQDTPHWETFAFSTGEQSILEYAKKKHAGARARVITFWGAPFDDDQKGDFVDGLKATACANFGHACPRIAQFILDEKANWPLWREAFQCARKHFAEKAGDNRVARRVSAYFAFFATAAPLLHAALPGLKPTITISSSLESNWKAVTRGAAEADNPRLALAAFWEFACANQGKFFEPKKDEQGKEMFPEFDPGYKGWAGRWERSTAWTSIAVIPAVLQEVLDKAGFEYKATLNSWIDRGWLQISTDRSTRPVRINKTSVRCYVIGRDIIEEILGIDFNKQD